VLAIAVGETRIEVNGIALAEHCVVTVNVDHELTRDDVDNLGPRVLVGLHRFCVRFEFRVVGLHLAIGHREIEAFEEIGWRFFIGAIWQAQAILLSDNRDRRPLACVDEEMLEADAEDLREALSE
jgi:hypothetical protein